MEEKTKLQLKWYSYFSGLGLGATFVYLFLWHKLGLSYVLFTALMIAIATIPMGLGWIKLDPKRVTRHIVGSTITLVFSLLYILRVNELIAFWSFLIMPFIYGYFIIYTQNPTILKQFGLFFLIKFPFIWAGKIFTRFFTYLSQIKFKTKLSERNLKVAKRVTKGLLISIPFLFIFIVLFSSADEKFAKLFGDAWEKVWSIWFDDVEEFISFVLKASIGIVVAHLIATINFFTWTNEPTFIQKLVELKDVDQSKVKKSWDYLTVSIFLTILNILFAFFVAVQFKYLFAGAENVIGDTANYTYAQYARRGFAELMQVTFLVYVILLVLNLLTDLPSKVSKYVFKINSTLFAVLTLIIGASAFERMRLLQEIYGYTDIRLSGMLAIITMGVLLVVVTVSLWVKWYVKFLSIATAIVLMLFVGIYFTLPIDYFVAVKNYDRFERTGQIDLPYLHTLSDEAVPVLIKFAENKEVPLTGRAVLTKELFDRYEEIKSSKLDWRSYNYVNSKNLNQLKSFYKNHNNEKVADPQSTLEEATNDYFDLLLAEKYEEAYAKYWSVSTEKTDLTKLENFKVDSVSNIYTPEYRDWDIVNFDRDYLGNNSYEYWSGMGVSAIIMYRASENQYADSYKCIYERVEFKLEDGQWKITSATYFALGRFKDGTKLTETEKTAYVNTLLSAPASCSY